MNNLPGDPPLPAGLATLAQEWQEFRLKAYKDRLDTPDAIHTMLEYRVCFYSGFLACLKCMAEVAQLPEEEQGAIVLAYMNEFSALARQYLEERQRHG